LQPEAEGSPKGGFDIPKQLLKQNEQPLLSILMFGVWALGYFAVAQFAEGRQGFTIPMPSWEKQIPFMPNFVWIYLSIYPVFLLPFLYIRKKEFFRLFSIAYITLMCVCYVIYIYYPTHFTERPPLTVDSFSTWALSKVYKADNTWNCFPSMHVAMSLLASLTILEVHRIRGLLAILLTLAISASTVLIKQHYVLDILASMVLTFLVYFIFFRKRILDTLFEYVQRSEVTLERWIARRIDQRVEEALSGSLREPLDRMVRSMVEDALRHGTQGAEPSDFSSGRRGHKIHEEEKT
jgi:membrane-associated phospholipid phosphatase